MPFNPDTIQTFGPPDEGSNASYPSHWLPSLVEDVQQPPQQSFGRRILSGIGSLLGGNELARGAGEAVSSLFNNPVKTSLQNAQTTQSTINKAKQLPVGSSTRRRLFQSSLDTSKASSGGSQDYLDQLPTNRQVAGSAGKLGLSALTLGSPGVSAGFKGIAGLSARALESGALGAGFQATSNLESGKPVKENLGLATVIGSILPGITEAGSAFYNKLTSELPSRIINSDIKPLLKDLSYGKNPGRAVARERITANNLEQLGQKIDEKVVQRGQEIGNLYEQAGPGKEVNYTETLKPIDDALARAQKSPRTNAGIIERLNNLKKDLLQFEPVKDSAGNIIGEQATRDLSNLSPKDAFQFKNDLADLTKFTGNKSDDNFVNKALKGVYHKIDSKLDTLIPGLEKANAHYTDLKSAQIATRYRDLINERHNLISFIPKIGVVAAAVYGLKTGDVKGATEYLLADIALGALGNTAAKTRIASILTRMEPGVRAQLLRSVPLIQRLLGK